MKKGEIYTIIVFIIIASLDNAAIALIPAILPSVAEGVHIAPEMAGLISFAVAAVTFVTAFTSFFWGYWGDKYSRKKLLLYGTIIWAFFIFLSYFSQTFWQLFIFQMCAGLGLGCIASVGFSIIVDFVSPSRRGLILSLWGLSQGIGSAGGYILAVVMNAKFGWNSAFLVLGLITFGFVIAYFFTVEPERGASEDELKALFKSGMTYDYRITSKEVKYILKIKTNKFIILQGFFAQIGWGGMQLLPTVLIYKLLMQGVPDNPADIIGPLIAGLFQIGGIFSIFWGWFGDKKQKKTLKARPMIAAMGLLIGVCLLIAMLLNPFQLVGVPDTNDFGILFGYIGTQFASNLLFVLAILSACCAVLFTSAESPNFFALVSDINFPEHRGTMYGFANFINGIGRTLGLIILPGIQLGLVVYLPLEVSWIYALIFTILFFIPGGCCYIAAIRTAPSDIISLKKQLAARADLQLEEQI
jgi:MFS family permease